MTLTDTIFFTEYRTGKTNDPLIFYKSAFSTSNFYARASGYFSSSVYELFKAEILKFAQDGGKMRLICSPVMSSDELKVVDIDDNQRIGISISATSKGKSKSSSVTSPLNTTEDLLKNLGGCCVSSLLILSGTKYP